MKINNKTPSGAFVNPDGVLYFIKVYASFVFATGVVSAFGVLLILAFFKTTSNSSKMNVDSMARSPFYRPYGAFKEKVTKEHEVILSLVTFLLLLSYYK